MTSLMMTSGMRLLMATAQPLVTQTTAAALSVGVLNRLPGASGSSVGLFTTPASFRYKSTAIPHVAAGDEDAAPQKVMPHKGLLRTPAVETVFPGPVYQNDYMEKIKPVHVPVLTIHQRLAFMAITVMRTGFDLVTGYDKRPGHMTEAKWVRRAIFLETVAGVPGMVAGMLRHMRSLRSLQKDNGWIHTLLEEAENERQHLLTFLNLRQPGPLFRLMVLLTQGIFFNIYFLAYIISPKICHAFVGYLEEEAVKTYTHILEEIDAGRLWVNKPAPKHAVDYWHLGENSTMRDVILAIRADEACHSHVNHTFSHTKPSDPSPFTDPKTSHLVPQDAPTRM